MCNGITLPLHYSVKSHEVLFLVGIIRFVQKVSGLPTVSAVVKTYWVLTLIVYSHTLRPVSTAFGNILRNPLSGCPIVSSSNLVCCPPLPQIGVLTSLKPLE